MRMAAALGMGGAVVNVLSAPFHGAAYFATESGSTDLLPMQETWGRAVRDAFPAMFSFADIDTVYLTYGKLTVLAVALYAVALAGLHVAQGPALSPVTRRFGSVALAFWGVLVLFAAILYYVVNLDVFFFPVIPALLGVVVCTAAYGWGMRKGPAGRSPGWMLLAASLLVVPLVAVAGHIPFGFLGFAAFWLVNGPGLRRPEPSSGPGGSTTP